MFTVGIIVFIITAILLSNDWPAAAKPVPLTACYMALTAATLNLVNELFGSAQAVVAGVDGGVARPAPMPGPTTACRTLRYGAGP